MKLRIQIIPVLLAAWLPLAVAGTLPLRAALTPPLAANTNNLATVSKFVIPTKPSEGRDPFFPNSMRLYAGKVDRQNDDPAPTGLALRSILGIPPHDFAIINNHTFAAGDSGDVITDSGQRLHIHCLAINLQDGTVTVEANGVPQVLHLPNRNGS